MSWRNKFGIYQHRNGIITDLPKLHSWQMVNPGLKLRSLRFKTPWGPHALPMPLLSVPCHRDLLFPPHYAPLVILHFDLRNTAYRLDNCPIPDKGCASQPTSVKPLPLELHVQGQFLIGGFQIKEPQEGEAMCPESTAWRSHWTCKLCCCHHCFCSILTFCFAALGKANAL